MLEKLLKHLRLIIFIITIIVIIIFAGADWLKEKGWLE
jgi:preprotein translocase subunit SecE